MTKRAKIGCVLAALFALALTGIIVAGSYLVVELTRGASEAREGDAAMRAGDYDKAIAQFDLALTRPLPASQRAAVLINRGTVCNLKRRVDEALRDFSEAIKLEPELAPPYIGRALAYKQKGDRNKALIDFNEGIRRDPNSAIAHYNRGSILFEEKDFSRALADFDEAVRCRPNDVNALIMRGVCYAAVNDLDRALASFDAALMLEPYNARALSERGRLYQRKGQSEKSVADLASARRLTPSFNPTPDPGAPVRLDVKPLPRLDTPTRSGFGQTFEQILTAEAEAYARRDFDKAITACDRALTMDITSVQASVGVMRRGIARLAKKENAAALADFEEAIRLNPRNAAAYDNRALALDNTGEQEEAMKDLAESIRLDPKDANAYFNRGAIEVEDGDLKDASTDYLKSIALKPDYAKPHAGLASLYLRAHENQKAIDQANQALQLDPGESSAYISRAEAYIRLKDYAKASSDFSSALKLGPAEPGGVLNDSAWLLSTCPEAAWRNANAAVEQATKACELSQWKNWHYLDTLAAAYAAAGRFEEAVRVEGKALDLAPPNDKQIVEAKQRLDLYRQHKAYREPAKP